MTKEQVRNDLKEIKYYNAHKKMLQQSFSATGENVFVQKIEKYNNTVRRAQLRLHEIYVGLYITGLSQEALAEKWGVSRMYVYSLNKSLVDYFAANM